MTHNQNLTKETTI